MILKERRRNFTAQVADIYEQLEMDLPTAFRMFMKKSKQVKGLPFEAVLPEPTLTRADAFDAFYEARRQMADVPEMTLDEINAEIDTNVFISALITKNPEAATVKVLEAVLGGELIPLYHQDILAEYETHGYFGEGED